MAILRLIVSLGLVIFHGSFAQGQVVINEFFPDPPGADSGQEFIELLNTGSVAVDLYGMELQFANGAEEANWLVRWSCDQVIILEPGGYYLLADRNWQGDAEAGVEVYLGLQNGPDAIRLTHGPEILDLVGYGPLTDAALMEQQPVPVVPGFSLGRRPDGQDTGNNFLDFVSTDPTPGRENFQPYSLRILDFTCEPPSAGRRDETVTFNITLENNGTETLATGQVVLQIGSSEILSVLDGNEPGQQRTLLFQGLPGQWGRLPVHLRVPLQNPEDVLDVLLGHFQVGHASLVINEILGSPDQGQGEWVELLIAGEGCVNLSNFRIKDEGGTWQALPSWDGNSGDLVVIAQDSLALGLWIQEIVNQGGRAGCEQTGNRPAPLLEQGPWPSLNNTAPEGRDYADRLYLCDAGGCVIDHVTLGWELAGLAQDLPDGHSLERVGLQSGTPEGSLWAPALAQTGSTPGCENSVKHAEIMGPGISVTPPVLDPDNGVGAINIGFELEWPAEGWDLRIYDLWGQLVRDLGGEMYGPGPRQLFWDGKSDQGLWVPTGAYVLLLRTRTSGGRIQTSEKILVPFKRPCP